MNRRMKLIWLREIRHRLFIERWRAFVRRDGGAVEPIEMGRGEWNRFYCADPFLFRHQGVNWLFYETLDKRGKGVLGCFKEVDGELVNQGVVLSEGVHLSYPQVFEENGRIWMIPESADYINKYVNGSVSLYEATDFPRGWVRRATLIDKPFADSTLYRKGGHYYLSCHRTIPSRGAELWQSDALEGPWTCHPESENTNQSIRLRRCGGSFLHADGRLYRVSQDCNGDYGKRLFRVPIAVLTPFSYREGDAEPLLDPTVWPLREGRQHTYNRLEYDGHVLEVIDQRDYVRKPILWLCVSCVKMVLHTLFYYRRRKSWRILQIFGIQFVKGPAKLRPGLVRVES